MFSTGSPLCIVLIFTHMLCGVIGVYIVFSRGMGLHVDYHTNDLIIQLFILVLSGILKSHQVGAGLIRLVSICGAVVIHPTPKLNYNYIFYNSR